MLLPALALTFALPLLLPPLTAASPLTRRQIDTSSHCGQWDTVAIAGTAYTLILDQWGLAGASAGSDCARVTGVSGGAVAWAANWTWTGGTGVKSFTNVGLDDGLNVQVGQISAMPTTWKWSQKTSGSAKVVADVAYDLFTSPTPGGSAANEIMVWLANYNAGPISATYDASGQPVPVASAVALSGQTWNLYSGSNGANNVFSFLPASGNPVTSFTGDINDFLKYLSANQGLPTSQYLTTAQAGTEATSGSATLTT
ncbi:concanavalin A-like lectin/glucanase [Dentipellis sp. KUC8613]|nr:concanavalin A-like lectin/glucanase [Dentipellis sp. KUC8613]